MTSIQKVAVCLPAHNELGSLPSVLAELEEVARNWVNVELTVVVFDDGSQDGTEQLLEHYSSLLFSLVTLRSRVRVGKAQALSFAFAKALEKGSQYVFMMDADGQDDPHYLPAMLQELLNGADLLNGRRTNREHPFASRLASKGFNFLARRVTRVKMLDINSGLKGFSRDAVRHLQPYLYGELHRVVVIMAIYAGFRVSEIRVVNRPRIAGHTKYGIARGWRAFFDLITLRTLYEYQNRPGHMFGALGGFFLAGAAAMSILGTTYFFDEGSALQGWFALVLFSLGFGITALGLGFVSELTLFLSRSPTRTIFSKVYEGARSAK